jgi:serine/threonine protein kinase
VDIWALGVTIVALTTGHFPFTSDNEFMHAVEVISAPPMLDAVKSRFGEDLVDLVQSMLATNPEAQPTIDECLKHRWVRRGSNML